MANSNGIVISPRMLRWISYLFSAAPVLLMLFSAWFKLSRNAQAVEQFVSHYGFAEGAFFGLGILETATVVVYLIPQTSVLGAILITGYLGGATAAEFRVGSPTFIMPALLGMLAWGGLFLRDARVRALIPLRRRQG
jgi:hypothetical protein